LRNWDLFTVFLEIIVADTGNHRVTSINKKTFIVKTIAGNTPASDIILTKLYYPQGVAITPTGTIAIADTGNNRILIIGKEGDTPVELKDVKMICPKSLCFSKDEMNVFIIDCDHRTSKVISYNIDSKTFDIVAGDIAGYEDGIDSAKFNKPSCIITGDSGNLIIADTKNSAIRSIMNQCVSTLYRDESGDFQPVGIAFLPTGILIADPKAHVIYRLAANRNIKVEYQIPPPAPELCVKTDITIPLSTVDDIKSVIANYLGKDPMYIRIDIVRIDKRDRVNSNDRIHNTAEKLVDISMISDDSFLRVVDLPKPKE